MEQAGVGLPDLVSLSSGERAVACMVHEGASGAWLRLGTEVVLGLGWRVSGPAGMVLGKARRLGLRPVACFRSTVDGSGS